MRHGGGGTTWKRITNPCARISLNLFSELPSLLLLHFLITTDHSALFGNAYGSLGLHIHIRPRLFVSKERQFPTASPFLVTSIISYLASQMASFEVDKSSIKDCREVDQPDLAHPLDSAYTSSRVGPVQIDAEAKDPHEEDRRMRETAMVVDEEEKVNRFFVPIPPCPW